MHSGQMSTCGCKKRYALLPERLTSERIFCYKTMFNPNSYWGGRGEEEVKKFFWTFSCNPFAMLV